MSTRSDVAEPFTLESASRLADKVRAYWAGKGKNPMVVVKTYDEFNDRDGRPHVMRICVVRSDMIDGRPR